MREGAMEIETEPTQAEPQSPASGNGAAAGATETFEVHNPADGSVVETLPVDGPERVRDVVARVRAAQPEWEAMGIAGRYEWLGRLRDWLIENGEPVAEIMRSETGKVRGDAALETPYLADLINFYGQNGPRFLADEHPTPHLPLFRVRKLTISYRPHPVVGIISPWNFPLMLSLGDAIPALMAGAAVVLKPSEFTPLSLMEVVRAWKEEIGGPDVLDVVNGTGETGGALIDEVDFIQFTGSDRTGRVVMKRAADTLTPVSLELGGKDPMIVLADADIERATNAATWGGMANSGQICMSIERVYVEEPIYDEFVSKLTEKVSKLRQGTDGSHYEADVGAMATPAQVDIVDDHVEDARRAGARILTGGKRKQGPGDWYEPTVIADADHSMKAMTDETFGPTLPVMKVRDAEEAVRLANDSRYGLSASVFSTDQERAESIARRIECGAVNINDVLANYQQLPLPMGGWKSSGIGFRHGASGIRKFVRSEAITQPRIRPLASELQWFPYSNRKRSVIRSIYRFFNARGLRDRLGLGGRGK
jgi:acyl-CoA reductase-like NAD-dependent aldehyde dehydrogenase